VPDGVEDETVTSVLGKAETMELEALEEGEAVELALVELRAAEPEGALELEGATLALALVELGEPLEPEHASSMLLSCHVADVEEKLDHDKPATALPFAPEKEVRGIVTVWVLPVRPVTW
jgi:hypothetical protein